MNQSFFQIIIYEKNIETEIYTIDLIDTNGSITKQLVERKAPNQKNNLLIYSQNNAESHLHLHRVNQSNDTVEMKIDFQTIYLQQQNFYLNQINELKCKLAGREMIINNQSNLINEFRQALMYEKIKFQTLYNNNLYLQNLLKNYIYNSPLYMN
jgi:hypothetical protein